MRNNFAWGRGALPRIRWGAVAAGVLSALAVHILLNLFGLGLGFASDVADSEALGTVSVIWNILVPLAASFVGAHLATRIAASLHPASPYLHGGLVWAIGLVLGAVFLTSSIGSGLLRAERGDVADTEEASRAAAAASALAGVAALFGLGGALLGAATGRRAMFGDLTETPVGTRGGQRRERAGSLADKVRHAGEELRERIGSRDRDRRPPTSGGPRDDGRLPPREGWGEHGYEPRH